MTKALEQLYLLGSSGKRVSFNRPVTQLRKRSQIKEAVEQEPKSSSVWISLTSDMTDELLREIVSAAWRKAGPARSLGRLLLLFPPRLDSLPALEEFFKPVAWGTKSFRHLPQEELADVLSDPNRRNLFIAGFVDGETETVILYRGDFDRIAVPNSFFRAHGSGPKPDPSQLSIEDCGQTVRLGDYEAAADAILYEADSEFRREVNAKRRSEEKTFGASLRRLRVMKGLRQSDFSSVPTKTIARIERGEVGKPHRETLEKIARRLGVAADEIESF